MGDEFIKKKTQSYKHQAEKIHAEEFSQTGVFTDLPEETTYAFRFKSPGIEPQLGDEIWLADIPGKTGVRVMLGTTTIGEVDGAGSTKLREIMAENAASGGVLPGVVVGEKDVSGYAKAKVSL
jgi:hypothetical protein